MPDKLLAELFDRYLNGEATPEEIKIWMEWLQQPGNEAEAQRLMQEGWEHFRPSQDVLGPDASDKLLENILTTEPSREERPGRLIRLTRLLTAGHVAAAIILLAIGGIYWATRPSSHPPVAVAPAKPRPVSHDIVPGTDGALLILADGHQIVLDSAGNGELAREGNTSIVKQGGRLSYTVNSPVKGSPSYNTMRIPRGRQFQLILPDRSHVWLNAASSIRYPTAFMGKERVVEITGEAYFEVAPDARRPFRVQAGEARVDVLGTDFNIMAYEEENAVRTTLLEGRVKVTRDGASHLLRPGQEARVLRDSPSIQVVNDAPLREAVAWKNGLFYFHNGSSLQTVMRQIERWYDVNVVYEGTPHEMEFGGKMTRNSNLSEVLKILEISKVHFRIENKTIVVMP
ncbi:MAG TPA: FecR domain-containing protein [Puia sp.]|nr:FecR domain-containing protein [Puia sp.]